jgi:hypothetical protein
VAIVLAWPYAVIIKDKANKNEAADLISNERLKFIFIIHVFK